MFCTHPLLLDQVSCSSLNDYLRGQLGEYLLNVSTAAELCSQALCASHGRCQRRQPDADVYLHLDPLSHAIAAQGGKLAVTGALGDAERGAFRADFQCRCYNGYHGDGCDQPKGAARAAVASVAAVLATHLLLVSLLLG